MKKNSIWIDHSTTHPDESIRLSKLAYNLGLQFLECPLTGGMDMLRQGQMATLVGGDENTFKYCLPLLLCYTGTQHYMGKVG